jgi:hypothetical protein
MHSWEGRMIKITTQHQQGALHPLTDEDHQSKQSNRWMNERIPLRIPVLSSTNLPFLSNLSTSFHPSIQSIQSLPEKKEIPNIQTPLRTCHPFICLICLISPYTSTSHTCSTTHRTCNCRWRSNCRFLVRL